MHARVPVIFSIQETKSWDVRNLKLPGYMWYGSKFGARHVGFESVLHNYEIVEVRREMYNSSLWNHCGDRRWCSRLKVKTWRGTKPSSRVSLQCSRKDAVVEPENSTLEEIVELGMMCTDETDIEELNEMDPCVGNCRDKDPRGFEEADVERNEGVQVQGHIYMVQVRKGKKRPLREER